MPTVRSIPARSRKRNLPPAQATLPLFPIVGIGASAGGLDAFLQLLKHLRPDTGMGFVLIQHLDPAHASALPELLSRATTMPVHEVADGVHVKPNQLYVIPPGKQMTIVSGVLRLKPRLRTRGTPQRCIDYFMESLAHDRRERAIGIILSGTATDGTLGLESIKGEGGITFAQDDSAKHPSMPRSAVAAGCVDYELSLFAIARELARIARHPHVAGGLAFEREKLDAADAAGHARDATPLPSGGHDPPRNGVVATGSDARMAHGHKSREIGLKKILGLIRNHAGVDFSLYRSATIQRRIARRMVLRRLETVEAYGRVLNGNPQELSPADVRVEGPMAIRCDLGMFLYESGCASNFAGGR